MIDENSVKFSFLLSKMKKAGYFLLIKCLLGENTENTVCNDQVYLPGKSHV